jgi:hypothetical protein
MSVRFLPGVCSLIRENAHNQFMASTTLEILPFPLSSPSQTATIYPQNTPPLPPFPPTPMKIKRVTSIKRKTTCENKRLTSRSLSKISHFIAGMQQSLSTGEAQPAETAIVSNPSYDCPRFHRALFCSATQSCYPCGTWKMRRFKPMDSRGASAH